MSNKPKIVDFNMLCTNCKKVSINNNGEFDAKEAPFFPYCGVSCKLEHEFKMKN